MNDNTVIVELYKSNSIGSRYIAPSLIERLRVSREKANKILDQKLTNGYYWQERLQWKSLKEKS